MASLLLERFVPVSALRTREPGKAVRVTSTELFFDLVYVFSIIQLSHFLLYHLTPTGALQAATLFRRSIARPVPVSLLQAAGAVVVVGAVAYVAHLPALVLGVGVLVPLLALAHRLGRHEATVA